MNKVHELVKEKEVYWRSYAHEMFKDHVATMKDYGDIVVIDWKDKSGSHNNFIRFLFEEDECRLNISGDQGCVSVWNGYRGSNVCLDHMQDFLNDAGYFVSKIQSHENHGVYDYEEDMAKAELEDMFGDWDDDDFANSDYFSTKDEFFKAIMDQYNSYDGLKYIDDSVLEGIQEVDPEYYEWLYDFGKVISCRIYFYLEGLRMAMQQLKVGCFSGKSTDEK